MLPSVAILEPTLSDLGRQFSALVNWVPLEVMQLFDLLLWFIVITLPETNIAPENRPSGKEISSSNHPFSGAMLVSGRVDVISNKSLRNSKWEWFDHNVSRLVKSDSLYIMHFEAP